MDTAQVVEKQIYIKARPETIFPFFTDPDKMVQWKGVSATLEPHNGGLYRVSINDKSVARGQYVEITPYERIVFTWGWEGENSPLAPGASTVEVLFTAEEDGTTVTLRHYLPADQTEQHLAGWNHYLPRLVAAAEGQQINPDPWATETSK